MRKIVMLIGIFFLSTLLFGCNNNDYNPEDFVFSEVIDEFKLVESGKITFNRIDAEGVITTEIFTFGNGFVYHHTKNIYYEQGTGEKILKYQQLDDGLWGKYDYPNRWTGGPTNVASFITSLDFFYDFSNSTIDGDYFLLSSETCNVCHLKIRVNNDGMIDYAYEYIEEDNKEVIGKKFFFEDLKNTQLTLPEASLVEYYVIELITLIEKGAVFMPVSDGVVEISLLNDTFNLVIASSDSYITASIGNKTFKTNENEEHFIKTDDGDYIEVSLSPTQIDEYIDFNLLMDLYEILGNLNSYYRLIG